MSKFKLAWTEKMVPSFCYITLQSFLSGVSTCHQGASSTILEQTAPVVLGLRGALCRKHVSALYRCWIGFRSGLIEGLVQTSPMLSSYLFSVLLAQCLGHYPVGGPNICSRDLSFWHWAVCFTSQFLDSLEICLITPTVHSRQDCPHKPSLY